MLSTGYYTPSVTRELFSLIDRYLKLGSEMLKIHVICAYHATKFAQKRMIANTLSVRMQSLLVPSCYTIPPSRLAETRLRDRLSMSFVKVFR